VEGFELHTVLRKLVDVRRLDITAAIAEISIAEIVGEDDNDVGLTRLGGESWGREGPLEQGD
jgi:hypothetical protein